jgi:hypothetical protein
MKLLKLVQNSRIAGSGGELLGAQMPPVVLGIDLD